MRRIPPCRQGALDKLTGPGVHQTKRKDNVDPAFLQPQDHCQLALPYSRTHRLNPLSPLSPPNPPNPPPALQNFPNGSKKGEMSQFRAGESSNSSNNTNSFNNNTDTFNNNTNSFNNTINNTTTNNNTNHISNVNNYGSVDERDKILAWLSPLEPRIRHHDIRSHRVEHVGDWLLQTEEYRNWFDGIRDEESGGSALFCHGAPGVGKTYIR